MSHEANVALAVRIREDYDKWVKGEPNEAAGWMWALNAAAALDQDDSETEEN